MLKKNLFDKIFYNLVRYINKIANFKNTFKMLLKQKNLVNELIIERNKFDAKFDIINDVRAILAQNELERDTISLTLKTKSSTNANAFDFDLLETNAIFHIEQIKTICIDYRLRFLDSNLFKNEIPDEAISKIRVLEKNHNTKLEGFKIVAPSKTFELENYDDPLLFAPIGNNYYYLIHQLGKDLDPLRKLKVMPFKNLMNFVLFCVAISLVLTLIIPTEKLAQTLPLAPVLIFLFMLKGVIASISYYFFLSGKNFNSEIWNRKFKEN